MPDNAKSSSQPQTLIAGLNRDPMRFRVKPGMRDLIKEYATLIIWHNFKTTASLNS